MGPDVTIISQDEIVPPKVQRYLSDHPTLSGELTKHRSRKFFVTDLTDQAVQLAARLYGKSIKIERVKL